MTNISQIAVAAILLLGSDSRGGIGETFASAEGDRSDVMLMMRISGDREYVTAMSIMRDMWWEGLWRSDKKINAALAIGGVPLTAQTVENLLDTRIDRVVVLDFEWFKTNSRRSRLWQQKFLTRISLPIRRE